MSTPVRISEFRSSDLSAVGYMLLKKIKLLRIERTDARSTFVFEPAAAGAAQEFYSGQAQVEPQEFAACLQQAKRALFGRGGGA